DRVQLKLHRETRELPVYWLVVDKKGMKIEATGTGHGGRVRNGRGLLDAKDQSMHMLAYWLEGAIGRRVVDKTGVSGGFDFKLEWSPTIGEPNPDRAEVASDPGLPTLFTALQEQLGLRLEAHKGPIEVLVIDRAEKPSEN